MLGQRAAGFYSLNKTAEVLGASIDETIQFPRIVYRSVDITKRDEVKKLIADFCPDVIVNAAAFTNVDLAETERETAWKINVTAVEAMAEAARLIDAHLIHISTDYIFNGAAGPYSENDRPSPLGYYGKTKLASENVLRASSALYTIIRTNVLYGIIPNGRLDFVRWVVDSIRQDKTIRIVTDQLNNPTFIDDLVEAIDKIIQEKKYGIYNIGGMEILSRFDFTMRIVSVFNLPADNVQPIKTPDLRQPAKRPLRSGLIILKAQTELDFHPTDLDDTLRKMKQELQL
jgi:dTDP-4-dehydrorhamnose reductase